MVAERLATSIVAEASRPLCEDDLREEIAHRTNATIQINRTDKCLEDVSDRLLVGFEIVSPQSALEVCVYRAGRTCAIRGPARIARALCC